jgi:guanine deaminase
MTKDMYFLEKAVSAAVRGIKTGGGPFGALIVKDGRVISLSVNKVVTSGDPTAHAEIMAIRKAARMLKTHDLTGCVLYASCEPCPMCLGAIYWARISRVVYAAGRNDAADAGFDDSLIYNEIRLDPSERKIPFDQIAVGNSGDAFAQWLKSENKIPY